MYTRFLDAKGKVLRGRLRFYDTPNGTTAVTIGRVTRYINTDTIRNLLTGYLGIDAPPEPKVIKVPVFVGSESILLKYRNLHNDECIKTVTSLKLLEDAFEARVNDILVVSLPIKHLISIERTPNG